MRAIQMDVVDLASYWLRDAAASWYDTWEESYGENAPPAIWSEFSYALSTIICLLRLEKPLS